MTISLHPNFICKLASLVKISGKILHDFARTLLQDFTKESQARIVQDSDKII